MTAPTLEDRVVAFITKRGGGVSFLELERAFSEEVDEKENPIFLTSYYSITLCQPVSLAMAWALESAINNGRIVTNPSDRLVHFEDGEAPVISIARRARMDGAARWLPVTLSPAEAGEPKDRGEIASRSTEGRRC